MSPLGRSRCALWLISALWFGACSSGGSGGSGSGADPSDPFGNAATDTSTQAGTGGVAGTSPSSTTDGGGSSPAGTGGGGGGSGSVPDAGSAGSGGAGGGSDASVSGGALPLGALCVEDANCSQAMGAAVCCVDTCTLADQCGNGGSYLPCNTGGDCMMYGGGRVCCDVSVMRFCTKPSACTGQTIP